MDATPEIIAGTIGAGMKMSRDGVSMTSSGRAANSDLMMMDSAKTNTNRDGITTDFAALKAGKDGTRVKVTGITLTLMEDGKARKDGITTDFMEATVGRDCITITARGITITDFPEKNGHTKIAASGATGIPRVRGGIRASRVANTRKISVRQVRWIVWPRALT